MLLRGGSLECDGRDSVSLTFGRTVGTDEERWTPGVRSAVFQERTACGPSAEGVRRSASLGRKNALNAPGPSVCTAALAGGDLR